VFERYPQDLLRAFVHHFGIRCVEFEPPVQSPLAIEGSSVRLQADAIMFPEVLATGQWQREEIDFFGSRMRPDTSYVLLDIGANAGLICRQALKHYSQIVAAHCFEPDVSNYACLTHNLSSFRGVTLHHAALSDRDGSAVLFLDESNAGNYSLNASAVEAKRYRQQVVRTVETGPALTEIVATLGAKRLIWKSDTQGYDEYLATLAPLDFWDHVDLAVVEIWRLPKPACDRERFRQILDKFTGRRMGEFGELATTEEILAFSFGPRDGKSADLFLWK
jgi:FkbM family methyltransferase